MDYYQKYQKYKLKYLNLLSLNLSGGDTYTYENYIKLIEGIPEDKIRNINENSEYDKYKKYLLICKLAVEKNGLALKYVKEDEFNDNDNDYSHLCYAAVKVTGLALQFVNSNKIKESIYIEICKTAFKQNPDALLYIPEQYKDFINDINYCTVQEDSRASNTGCTVS